MRLRHIVVVVPGVGGSVLESRPGDLVWGQDRRRLVGALLDPGRLSVAEHRHLKPVDLLRSITVVPPFPFSVHGYDGLIRAVEQTFEQVIVDTVRPGVALVPGADVVLFPYDFRLGVRDAAYRLQEAVGVRLADLAERERVGRVIVVGHSLGGLVARYWLGPLGGARFCRALITVGTPHRGAPKALDWLVNGIQVGPARLSAASGVLREWATVFDLLPRYRAVLDDARGEELYPHELAAVVDDSFRARAQESYAMHEEIEREWAAIPQVWRPEVIPLFARGHATPSAAHLSGTQLKVRKVDADWLPNVGWAGDGTVPAISAIPLELDEQRGAWTPVIERHTPMASAPVIVDLLRNFAGESLAAVRGDAPDLPWLGMDLDDQAPAGEAVPVGVILHGLPQGSAGVTVWVTVVDVETGRRVGQPLQLTTVGEGWSGLVGPLPAGGYRVVAQAVNVPGPERVTCEDVLSVVELR